MSIGTTSVSSDGGAVEPVPVAVASSPQSTSAAASSQTIAATTPAQSPPESAVSLRTTTTSGSLVPVDVPSTKSSTASTRVEQDEASSGPSKLPKHASATKVKQRRKPNQSTANDEFIYKSGPSTAGGTIGTVAEHAVCALAPAGGGNRKTQPELVLPFQLPFTDVRPKLPVLDNASVQVAMSMGASETSSPDSASDSDDYSVLSDDSDDDSDDEESRKQARRRRKEPATIEESLVLLQSLRQSRLSHLSSLLTPFSQRVRSGMIYPNVLPLSLLHGLNPRDPHVLIQLGRADIHVGPHVFVRTKFWEVRPDYEVPSALTQATRMRPTTYGGAHTYSHVPRPLSTAPATAPAQPNVTKSPLPAVPAVGTSAPTVTPHASTLSNQAVTSPASSPVPVQVLPAAPSAAARSSASAAMPSTVSTPASSVPAPASVASTTAPTATKAHVSLPQPSMSATKAAPVTVALPRPPTVTPSLPRPPSLSQNPNTSTSTSTPTPVAQSASIAPQRQPLTATKAAAPASASASASSSVATAPAPVPSRPAVPPSPPPPPAIDAVLVSRVNATAALNPDLQELLHVAASGKASPTQLKALGVWIQAITAQLREDEARTAAAAKGGSSAIGSAASSSADLKKIRKNKADETVKANKKQAKQDEREAKKRAKADAKNKGQQHNHHPSGKLPHPPPGWPTDGPPKPPVVIVEFRENPSMRFILPLWKCLVERTEGMEQDALPKIKTERRGFFDNDSDNEEPQKLDPELKLSFFAPSLGSDAADGSGLRELEEELKRKAAEEAASNGSNSPTSTTHPMKESSPATVQQGIDSPASASTGSAPPTDTVLSKKKDSGLKKVVKVGRHKVSVNESGDDPLGRKHEIYPLTWSIKNGVSESLWEAFGRVPGTMTCQPVKREPEIELEPDVAEFLVPEIRYHLLDLPMEEIKIQKETAETFVDLYAHMPERHFVLPRIAPAFLPQGLQDHMMDKFAVRSQAIQGRPIVKRKAGARDEDASFSYEGIGLTVIGSNGIKAESGTGPPKPPKRKRHVATHNPDGSLKSCGACGKTKTPMWRRGPKGPSQLCNACGARWKAGRLVVPEIAPPAIIEPEEDKVELRQSGKDGEDAHEADKSKGSPHGSNALIVPQTSEVDDTGNYTLTASSGTNSNTVAAVASPPYGDAGGGPYTYSESKNELDFTSPHMSRGSASPSPFIRSPIAEDELMPASVDPSMLSGSARVANSRR